LIDYWNFQLMWNERGGGKQCDWTRVSSEFCKEASRVLETAALGSATLDETRVYAG
jgi:hypothetical protein